MTSAAPGERLRGKALFLSASVPSRFAVSTNVYEGNLPSTDEMPDQDLRIETAVSAFARAVFREGGQLVFGGHPAISPLVAMVAAEYFEPSVRSAGTPCDATTPYPEPILIYQSEAFRAGLLAEVQLMQRLGQARICWTAAVDGEKFDSIVKEKQCQKSLKRMREHMFARFNVVAMAAIGGMDGVFDELELFQASGRPAFVLGSTGGASTVLAKKYRVLGFSVPDDDGAHDPPAYDDVVQRMIDDIVPDDGESPLPPPHEPTPA